MKHQKHSITAILKAMMPDMEKAGATARKQVYDTAVAAADREIEALRLYRPQPFQEELHSCHAKECVMMKSNRAGGTLSGCVEVARAVTGQDPHNKYPKEDGIAVVMGAGLKHIGRVFHRLLFRPGGFLIIKDHDTKEWRTYRPWPHKQKIYGEHGDLERKEDAKKAPPLIPKRFIKSFAWEQRATHIFTQVEFTTGWTLFGANTAGDPNQFQGGDAHLVLIDEDTSSPGWYNEMVGRTSGVDGLLRWTALPHMKNNELMNLLERAEDEDKGGGKDSIVIRVRIKDNAYIEEKSKQRSVAIWKSQGDEVYQQRALGEVSLDSRLMYPTFDIHLHEGLKTDEPRLPIQEILAKSGGDPPQSWCRYAAIDPGHTICAVAFLAVPPPEIGDYVVQYDELYLNNCTAQIFGEQMHYKVGEQLFQEFIIDAHGGKLTSSGSGIQPMRQYEDELENRKVRSISTGSGFRHGSDDVEGRVGLLRTWLSIRQDGTTKFLIICRRCPNTVLEFRRFRKKQVIVNGVHVPIDEGERRRTHVIECLEYLAAHGCAYIKPRTNKVSKSWFDTLTEQRRDRAAQRAMRHGSQQATISLGPKG